MQFKSVVTICGIKASQGEFEGKSFDSTKLYCLTGMDESKGTQKGMATVEYTYGTSAEFQKLKALDFPVKAEITFELVTNGKVQKTNVVAVAPMSGKAA